METEHEMLDVWFCTLCFYENYQHVFLSFFCIFFWDEGNMVFCDFLFLNLLNKSEFQGYLMLKSYSFSS